MLKRAISLLVFTFFSIILFGQDTSRIGFIEGRLKQLAEADVPGLNEKVVVSVSGVAVDEFIRGIAIANNLNISVDPNLKLRISVNFANESVMNILLFLCKQYDLQISFTGSIMFVSEYIAPKALALEKDISITYDTQQNLMSIDARNDTLYKVIKKIIQVSGTNVIASPDVSSKIVTAYIQNLPLETALDKMAFANQMQLTKNDDGTFYISALNAANVANVKKSDENKKNAKGQVPDLPASFNLKMSKDANGQDVISVTAINTPIEDMIKYICQQLKIDYFLFSDLQGKGTVNVNNISFDGFLNYLFKGTDYDFRIEKGVYLIGARIHEGFTTAKFIPLQYRPTDIVIDNIPSDIKKGLEVKAFKELNSLIVSGPTIKVEQLEQFVKGIDKVVPVVLIKVIIIDLSDSRTVTTGLNAGIGTSPVQTSGTVFPGVNVTIGSQGVNNVLSMINSLGIVNLGQVIPNFYVNLQLLEEQGILNIRSTPQLSTLNGHEATLSIGETDYYLEQTNNIIGTQNPQNVVTNNYKPIKADLSVSITPTVSGDDEVTMDITVKQSEFTTRISPTAPPGTTDREFKSLIRVKSDEMIVLGGMEQATTNDSGSGFPLLSRIPVLKWLFSNRSKTKSKTKLSILIKPTIIY